MAKPQEPDDNILDALHTDLPVKPGQPTAIIIHLSDNFCQHLIEGYKADSHWSLIINEVKQNSVQEQPVALLYWIDGQLLFLQMVDGTCKLYVPQNMHTEVLQIAHDTKGHLGLEHTIEHLQGIALYKTW